MQAQQGYIKKTVYYLLLFLFTIASPGIQAKNSTVNLTIAYKRVHFAGKYVRAIAVNNQIPGPTLHFKQGDHVTINVYNHIDRGTSIHWHGIILPWNMDGVDGITQKAIPPGGVFHYKFTLHQYGSYWYHAHSELQEQEGVYGGIIIDPPKQHLHYNKDFSIVLSDWNNTNPNKVYANLKKEGDFYAINKPMQPSLRQFFRDDHAAKTPQAKQQIRNAYKMMQTMRMSIYDISDVSYDAFLLNGHPATNPWTNQVKVGDIVRLRFIGAGANTSFQVKIPGASMQIIQVDGNNIKPYRVNYFTIAPGETYDVLIKITKNKPYIIYTESTDGLGVALGALLTQTNQKENYAAIKPFPKPKPIMMHSMPMSGPMSSASHAEMKGTVTQKSQSGMIMNHTMGMPNTINKQQHQKSMSHAAGHTITTGYKKKSQKNSTHSKVDHTKKNNNHKNPDSLSSPSKYDPMQSITKTNNPHQSVHVINMNLGGFMDRYIWFLNGVPFYKAKPIMIQHGQWYRIIFTNDTMMNHPMHIHGHWFILRNGHGAYDPKLHTIDVPPGATIVADLHADQSGQWFFHCHNLLHMKAGMANIFRYEETPQTAFIGLYGHKNIKWFSTSELELSADFFNNTYEGSLNTLIGSDYNKLQLNAEDTEIKNGAIENANMDIFYWRLISQFWAVKGGVNYVYRPANTPYIQPGIGIEGLLPYFIQTDIRAYLHNGSAKLDMQFARNTQLTHHLFLKLSIDSLFATKTVRQDEIGSGLNSLQWIIQPYYQLNPNLALYLQYQHHNNYGVLKNILTEDNKSTSDNSYSIGLSLLF